MVENKVYIRLCSKVPAKLFADIVSRGWNGWLLSEYSWEEVVQEDWTEPSGLVTRYRTVEVWKELPAERTNLYPRVTLFQKIRRWWFYFWYSQMAEE